MSLHPFQVVPRVLDLDGAPLRQHPEEDHPEGVDVAPEVGRGEDQELGRGKSQLPQELSRLRELARIPLLQDLRHAEVDDLHETPVVDERDQDVVRREVAVEDVQLLQVGQAHRRLDRERDQLGEGAPLEGVEVDPFEVFHHDRREPLARPDDLVAPDDVPVVERGEDLHLLDEPRLQLVVLEAPGHDLRGDGEARPAILRLEDDPHAALPQDAGDDVVVELRELDECAHASLLDLPYISD